MLPFHRCPFGDDLGAKIMSWYRWKLGKGLAESIPATAHGADVILNRAAIAVIRVVLDYGGGSGEKEEITPLDWLPGESQQFETA
jgi:hypothetical protein